MRNMDYCKFENTYRALMECLDNFKASSKREQEYAKKIFETVLEFAQYKDIIEEYDFPQLEEIIENMNDEEEEEW